MNSLSWFGLGLMAGLIFPFTLAFLLALRDEKRRYRKLQKELAGRPQ